MRPESGRSRPSHSAASPLVPEHRVKAILPPQRLQTPQDGHPTRARRAPNFHPPTLPRRPPQHSPLEPRARSLPRRPRSPPGCTSLCPSTPSAATRLSGNVSHPVQRPLPRRGCTPPIGRHLDIRPMFPCIRCLCPALLLGTSCSRHEASTSCKPPTDVRSLVNARLARAGKGFSASSRMFKAVFDPSGKREQKHHGHNQGRRGLR